MTAFKAPRGRFLAAVEFIRSSPPNRFARLRPIYQVDDLRWQSINDGDSRFLDDGLVFWWQPPTPVVEKSLWVVTLELQPKYGLNQNHKDRCQVAEAVRPYQAVALHGVKGPRAFRRTLASGRLRFDVPLLGRPLVRVVDEVGKWLALPEGLLTTTDAGLTSLTVTGQAGVWPVYSIDSDTFAKVMVEGNRYALLLDLGVPGDYQCALSDAQLVEHLRKKISMFDREVLDAVSVTKKLLREYVDVLEKAGLGGDDAAKEHSRRDAAEMLIEGLDAETADIDTLVETLIGHPRVKDSLSKRFEDELRTRNEHWERETDETRRAASDVLDATQVKIKAATHELKTLISSIDVAVADILDAPLEALARHGLVDALRRVMPSMAVRAPAIDNIKPLPEASPTVSRVEMIKDVKQLTSNVVSWASATGVDPYMLQVALASIVSHPVTLICGANAERLAVALASTVAGDRAVRVVVGATVFGLADLMCAPVSPIGKTQIDGAATLGSFLAAQSPDDFIMVILSGCNRAPPEIVLPEFLSILDKTTTSLAWSCADRPITRVALGPNLRIVGTMHSGDATYRVPSELAAQFGLVPSDHREIKGLDLPLVLIPSPRRIDPALYAVLQEPTEVTDIGEQVSWLRSLGVSIPAGSLAGVLAIYINLLSNPVRALSEAFAGMLCGREREPDLEGLPGVNADEIQKRVSELKGAPAWIGARCHFVTGGDR